MNTEQKNLIHEIKCLEEKAERPSDAAACSRILITLEITDPETVANYIETCDELLWEDLVNGSLINLVGFLSRENATDHTTTDNSTNNTPEK